MNGFLQSLRNEDLEAQKGDESLSIRGFTSKGGAVLKVWTILCSGRVSFTGHITWKGIGELKKDLSPGNEGGDKNHVFCRKEERNKD